MKKNSGLWSRFVIPTGTKGSACHVGSGRSFGPGWCYQQGPKALICLSCLTRTLLSRLGGPGWESRTKGLSQPRQNACSIVVRPQTVYMRGLEVARHRAQHCST